MVSWGAPFTLWVLGGGVGYSLRLFIWHWLLCSWHLSPFPVPVDPSPIPCLPFL